MTDTELIITTVQGWAPDTRLYRVGDAHWLISVISVEKLRDAIAETTGLELPDPHPPGGHVAIYRALYAETPLYRWIEDAPLPDEVPAGEMKHVEDGDTLTVLIDGDPIATFHREQYDVERTIAAIDADGDPLNGLTPQWILPHGTTFEQALDHIVTAADITTDEEEP